MWLAYSVNKEDMWISKIPVPITGIETNGICEDFSALTPGGEITGWTVYSPLWAPVAVENESGKNILTLSDTDPYDRAKAERTIPEAQAGSFSVRVRIDAIGEGNTPMRIELQDRKGAVPAAVTFGADRQLRIRGGGVYASLCSFEFGQWYDLTVAYDCVLNRFTVAVSADGKELARKEMPFAESVSTVERVLFTTKANNNPQSVESDGKDLSIGDQPDSDTRLPLSRMSVLSFSCRTDVPAE